MIIGRSLNVVFVLTVFANPGSQYEAIALALFYKVIFMSKPTKVP